MVIYTDGATLYCSHYFKYQLSEQNCNGELSKEEKKEQKGETVNGESTRWSEKRVASDGVWLTVAQT